MTCQCLPDEAEAPDIQLFMMAASTRGDGIGREAGLTQCFDDGFAGAIQIMVLVRGERRQVEVRPLIKARGERLVLVVKKGPL